ncbi:ATP-binding protein [Corallococcus sp. AB011P]|uniref:ATP-binding protein n=1 Tax=Corallococcus sp. AB011P TaxID=2316735 RepID=UPI000EA14810|nr:ATP-binding protein [Corallococcus sp. AB011P]RKG56889.1 ATP-binding protein [Corallococcus sp. AB011P]
MNDSEDVVELTLAKLKWLRLPGMASTLSALLTKAAEENLPALEVVSRLCDEERISRMRSSVAAKVRGACFPEVNTVDGFDFNFCPVRKKLKGRYLALHDVAFLDKGINPLFIGLPGTGKTYLARALAWRVCQANRRVVVISAARMLNELHGAELHGGLEKALRRFVKADLLVLDDFAVLAMDAAQAKLAFQVISERYDHRRSTCITTNRAFKEWPKVFPDALNAQVIAERLTERSERFLLDGKGFRNPET